jgi:hypothetical protein
MLCQQLKPKLSVIGSEKPCNSLIGFGELPDQQVLEAQVNSCQ